MLGLLRWAAPANGDCTVTVDADGLDLGTAELASRAVRGCDERSEHVDVLLMTPPRSCAIAHVGHDTCSRRFELAPAVGPSYLHVDKASHGQIREVAVLEMITQPG